MGGKGPLTRSVKGVTDQSRCCLPNESRTGLESRRLAFELLLGRENPRRRKLLARTPPLSQAPRPMNSLGRSQTCGGVLVAAALFTAFSWTLLVSVSPQLHARIHADAHRADHVCAITLIASGSYEHGAQPPLVIVPLPAVQFSKIPALTSCWVQSPFLGAHIFEHAPPGRG